MRDPTGREPRSACVHVCACVCMCVHSVCMCVHSVCMCVHVCACLCACVCMCVHVCMHVHVCACVCMCVHVHVHLIARWADHSQGSARQSGSRHPSPACKSVSQSVSQSASQSVSDEVGILHLRQARGEGCGQVRAAVGVVARATLRVARLGRSVMKGTGDRGQGRSSG